MLLPATQSTAANETNGLMEGLIFRLQEISLKFLSTVPSHHRQNDNDNIVLHLDNMNALIGKVSISSKQNCQNLRIIDKYCEFL